MVISMTPLRLMANHCTFLSTQCCRTVPEQKRRMIMLNFSVEAKISGNEGADSVAFVSQLCGRDAECDDMFTGEWGFPSIEGCVGTTKLLSPSRC